MSFLAKHSDQEITAKLFDRVRRPAPTDPVTGAPVARPRPVLDAIKAGLQQMIATFGPQFASTLMPLLLQLAQKYLGQISTTAAAGDSLETANVHQLFSELNGRHSVRSASTAEALAGDEWPILQALQKFVVDMIATLKPEDVMEFVTGLIMDVLGKLGSS